jgi:hypothetical protein
VIRSPNLSQPLLVETTNVTGENLSYYPGWDGVRNLFLSFPVPFGRQGSEGALGVYERRAQGSNLLSLRLDVQNILQGGAGDPKWGKRGNILE